MPSTPPDFDMALDMARISVDEGKKIMVRYSYMLKLMIRATAI